MHEFGKIYPKEFVTSYWCPECGKLIDVSSGRLIPYEFDHDGGIEMVSASIDFHFNCTDCDSYMLPIDYLISKQIKILNDMGYVTSYCCAGHLNQAPKLNSGILVDYVYTINSSYISFANIPENEHCKDVVKRLLTLQEFGFVKLEEDMEETWTIRAEGDLVDTFSDVRNGFIRFVNSLILNLDKDKEGD